MQGYNGTSHKYLQYLILLDNCIKLRHILHFVSSPFFARESQSTQLFHFDRRKNLQDVNKANRFAWTPFNDNQRSNDDNDAFVK